MNVERVREDFPILSSLVHGKRLAYLDNAATTLKPRVVAEKVAKHYAEETSNIHRGVHYFSEKATADFEQTRETIRNFIGAEHAYEVLFTKGTTEAINAVATSFSQAYLKEGDEVLVSHMEHHSNIVPWQLLRETKGIVLKVVPILDDGSLDLEAFHSLLSEKVKLVSMVYVSNALGTINPMKKIIQAAHEKNVPVLVDAAQTLSHIPIDVQELDCDFMAFSGHKLFGPTGVGVLYGKEKWLNEMPPYQGGGDMILNVTFEETTFNSLPHKFEAGTPHIAGVIGLKEAINYIENIGYESIQKQENALLKYGTDKLQQIDGLTLIGTAKEKSSVLSFVMENVHPHDLGTILDQEGVAIRAGHHCAQPVMDRFNIPATTRASLSFYNTKEDIDQLVEALIKAKELFA